MKIIKGLNLLTKLFYELEAQVNFYSKHGIDPINFKAFFVSMFE